MRLADYIRSHVELILVEWEAFARLIWPGKSTDPATLRDHAEAVLLATINDMASAQTEPERSRKSMGVVAGGGSDRVDSVSALHGADRAGAGFDLAEMVSEYRALRGSVLRLWRGSTPAAHATDLDDLTRFNESIDQSLTAAVLGYSEAALRCEAQLGTERAARAGAEAANRAKDAFLATLSHELRTPLNAIVMWLGIISRERCGGEELREGLGVIRRNTDAQVRLIEDILDVSRIVSGKFRLERRTCGVAEIVAAAVEAVRPDARRLGVVVIVRVDPSDPIRASCDPDRVRRIVGNLVGNAVKFSSAGGEVHVHLAREDAAARIEVRDGGRGISADFLPHVFDRFRQADDSPRRTAGGLGLGLSIAKHLVELHGGTISASSAGPGRGSTFTVRLPADGAAGEPAEGGLRAEERGGHPTAEPAPVRLDGLRVLVVDDEPDALRAAVKVLESAGAVVTATGGAADALEVLAAARPELLISDIGMPGLDGYDLIREVRRRGHAARDLPAIALTAFAQKDDQRQALLEGYQLHAAKPIGAYDLTAIVAALAGRAVANSKGGPRANELTTRASGRANGGGSSGPEPEVELAVAWSRPHPL